MNARSAVGTGLAAALLVGGLHLLKESAGKPDLWVDVPPTGEPVVGPADQPVSVSHLREGNDPGVDWTRWTVKYGAGAYTREVIRSELRGETVPTGAYVCGSELHAGAALFDTHEAGRGLLEMTKREVSKLFPFSRTVKLPLGQSITLYLPKVDRFDLAVRFGEGEVFTKAEVTLVDKTVLSIAFPARIVEKNGGPTLERIRDRPLQVGFSGTAREDVLRQARRVGGLYGAGGGCAVGMIFGPGGCFVAGGAGLLLGRAVAGHTAAEEIAARAPAEAAAALDAKLGEISLGLKEFSKPFPLDPNRPGDVLRVKLDGAPVVSERGLTLPICTSFSVAPPFVVDGAPGPVAVQGKAHANRPSDASFAISLSPGALHQALHYAWQSGQLRRLGHNPAVLAGLSDKVKESALDFDGFDPQLPPTLSPHMATSGMLPLVVGDVTLGSIGGRRVNGHALLDLSVASDSDEIRLDATVRELYIGCSEPQAAWLRLTPCLADLLPVAREMAKGQSLGFGFSRTDVLARLPAVAFRGLELEMSEPDAHTVGSPAGLTLGVRARFRATRL